MSNRTDELAALNAAASRLHQRIDAIQKDIVGKVKDASILSRVGVLQTEIEIAKRDIETITVLSDVNKKEPDVRDLVRTLKEQERELEELIAKYGLQPEDIRPKRWWEFWK